MHIQVCILGPSGIGKSPLANIFSLDGFEPYRVREPRNKEDERVCMTPNDYEKLLKEYANQEIRYESASPSKLRVYDNHAFFLVRGKPQVLDLRLLQTPDAKTKGLRIEIYAPILRELEELQHSKPGLVPLKPIFFLLNPLETSYRDMPVGDESYALLQLATLTAIIERERLATAKPVNLTEALGRVASLREEVPVWGELIRGNPQAIEIRGWSHQEYRHVHVAGGDMERLVARSTILNAIECSKLLLETKNALKATIVNDTSLCGHDSMGNA